MNAYSLRVRPVHHPHTGARTHPFLAPWKRLLARALLEFCAFFPAMKPILRRWGLRTWMQWRSDRAYRVSTPAGRFFRLAGRNYLSFELFWKGTDYYEPISTRVVCELLKPGDTFLDVGANIGFYALTVSTLKRGILVAAFEPNPANFALLQNNVRLNGYANIRCEPLALSDHQGQGWLYLSSSDMSASLTPDFDPAEGQPIPVRITTLDAFLAKHPPAGRLVIKVDVEGHEKAFFRGAVQAIETGRLDIVTEVTRAYDSELTALFRRFGYRFYPITDRGLVPAEVLQPVVRDRLVFLNCLITTRAPGEVAQMFARIAPEVRRLDLRKTSKHLSPDAMARFIARTSQPPPEAPQAPCFCGARAPDGRLQPPPSVASL